MGGRFEVTATVSETRPGNPTSGDLTRISWWLAAACLLLLALRVLMLTGAARPVLAALALLSAVTLLTVGWLARRRGSRTDAWLLGVVAIVPILNSITSVAVTGDLAQTELLMLSLVAAGAVIPSRRILLQLGVASTAAWTIVVVCRAVWASEGGRHIAHTAVQLGIALALAAGLHTVRSRREDGLRAARDELAARVLAEQAARRAQAESEQRYRSVFDDSPVGIGLADEHGRFVAANEALCRLVGRPITEVLGRTSIEFTHLDDHGMRGHANVLIDASDTGVARVEKRYIHPDGTVHWAWLTVRHTPGPHGETWTLAHVQDVTDRKQAEQVLADSEANLAALADVTRRIQRGEDARATIVEAGRDLAGASVASLAELSADGDLVVTASTHESLLNTVVPLDRISATAEVFRSGQAAFIPDPETHPLVQPGLLRLTGARALYLLPVRSRERTSGVLLVGWAEPIEGIQARPARAVELLADEAGVALEQQALIAELEQRAETDSMTGLPNRRGWDQLLGRMLAEARRRGTPLTVALADLDHFKDYNDTRGHLAGDDLLRTFSAATANALRAVDAVARWGGEEFAIGLPDCAPGEAPHALARIHAVTPDGQSCSIGYATWDTVETAEELMRRADQALYAAKKAGRNRSVAHAVA